MALRLPSDHIDGLSGDSQPSLCTLFVWVGGRSFFPRRDGGCDILFLQPSLCGLGAPCSDGPAPASFPGHGYRSIRWVIDDILSCVC